MSENSTPDPTPSATVQPKRKQRGPGRPWPKGVSPNPGGRPASEKEIVALAREGSTKAMKRLVKIADESPDEHAATAAAKVVLDRAYGKAKERVVGGDEDDKPIRVELVKASLLDRLKRLASEPVAAPAAEPKAAKAGQ